MAKTILVTGASSGFGRLTAETLSKSGHKVFAGFRSAEGARKQIADELKARNIEILKVDVTDQASVDTAIVQLLEKSGNKLDVVVNNAGGTPQLDAADAPPKVHSKIVELNLRHDLAGQDLAGVLGVNVSQAEALAAYDKAVALVCRERKASTSFVQRHLQIGYNRAARIIERMEAEGIVTPANHVGKREVLARGGD